jgi:hypothetical protein
MAGLEVTMTGDSAQVDREIAKLTGEVGKLKAKLADAKQAGKESGEQTASSMDGATRKVDSTIKSVAKLATGFVSVGSAVSLVMRTLEDLDRIAEEAAQKVTATAAASGELAQLADGDPQKLQMFNARAEALLAAGGARDLEHAKDIQFSLESGGIGTETQLAADAFIVTRGQPEKFLRDASKFQRGIGADEAGSLRDVLSKSLGASGGTPETAMAIMSNALEALSPASIMKIRDEEVMALMAVLTNVTKSPEQAGTISKALLNKMMTMGFDEGAPLMQSLQSIQGMNLSNEELKKLFGSEEALAGFKQTMSSVDPVTGQNLYTKMLSDIEDAQATRLFDRTVDVALTQEDVRAAREGRRSAGRLEIARRDRGIARIESESAIENELVRQEMENVSPFQQSVNEWVLRARRFFGGDAIISHQLMMREAQRRMEESEPIPYDEERFGQPVISPGSGIQQDSLLRVIPDVIADIPRTLEQIKSVNNPANTGVSRQDDL